MKTIKDNFYTYMVNEEYVKAKTKGTDEDNQQQPKDRG